uniref:Transmembrane protein n=1 Tax=Rhabditophanes sp. KR3021 TaxID=114890 RepID=A0AC35TMU0_9BILA
MKYIKKQFLITGFICITLKDLVSKLQFCYSIFAVILIFLSLHVSTKSDDSKLRNKAYMVNSNLKMAFCSLNKDFSNMVFESTCYLQKPEFFLKNKHLLNSKKGSSQICSNIKYSYKNISEIAEVFDKNHNFYNDFKLNAFVRDPVERLIDTYIEQCVTKKTTCNGCGRDLKCVVEGLYKKLIKFSNGKIKETSLTVIDQQLSLQSWSVLCFIFLYILSIIIRTYLSILRSRNATQDQILYIKKQYSKDVSLGSTLSQQLRSNLYNMLKIDPRMRFLLYKIYYYDYFEMNIDMPVWLKEVEVSKGTPKPYICQF